MHARKRFVWFLALTTVVGLTLACGGAAEEPPAEPPAEEAAPAPAPEPVPEEPQEEQGPQLEGNIVTSGENHEWISVTDADSPATYFWTVTVNNDTTQTLDITVQFDIVDENDEVVKRETKTVRLAPAAEEVIREESEMPYQDALRVFGFTAVVSDWAIVES